MTTPQPIIIRGPIVGEPVGDAFDGVSTLIYAVYLANGLVVTRPTGFPSEPLAQPTEQARQDQ